MQPEPIASPETLAFAKAVLQARRLRNNHLPDVELADPAWDMMLDLFVATEMRKRVSVSSLAIAAAVPKTNALRAMVPLVDQGLLIREPDPRDGRRVFMILSSGLHVRLNQLLVGMRSGCGL